MLCHISSTLNPKRFLEQVQHMVCDIYGLRNAGGGWFLLFQHRSTTPSPNQYRIQQPGAWEHRASTRHLTLFSGLWPPLRSCLAMSSAGSLRFCIRTYIYREKNNFLSNFLHTTNAVFFVRPQQKMFQNSLGIYIILNMSFVIM